MAALLDPWFALERYLQLHAPEALRTLQPPASPSALDAAQRVLDVVLPPDCRAWYALHDGAEWNGPLTEEILSLDGMLSTWRLLCGLERDGTFAGCRVEADQQVKPTWWNARWLPITSDGAGNHLCVDMDPTTKGSAGQIIRYWHDGGERSVVARNFMDLFAQTLNQLESGELVVSEDKDGYQGLMKRGSLTGSLADLRIRGENEEQWRSRVRIAARSTPQEISRRLVETLRRYQWLDLTRDALAGPMLAVQGALCRLRPAEHDRAADVLEALRTARGVNSVTVDLQTLRTVLEAIPFVEEVLGPPPPPRPRTHKREWFPDEPLAQLEHLLWEHKEPDQEWLATHAPGRRMDGIWNQCPRPRHLLVLSAATVDARTLAATACRCIRALRTQDELDVVPDVSAALTLVERWGAGEDVQEALVQTHERFQARERNGAGAMLTGMALAPTTDKAARLAACCIELYACNDAELQHAANLVRAVLPVPELDVVLKHGATRPR